jgi:hypothetical protein
MAQYPSDARLYSIRSNLRRCIKRLLYSSKDACNLAHPSPLVMSATDDGIYPILKKSGDLNEVQRIVEKKLGNKMTKENFYEMVSLHYVKKEPQKALNFLRKHKEKYISPYLDSVEILLLGALANKAIPKDPGAAVIEEFLARANVYLQRLFDLSVFFALAKIRTKINGSTTDKERAEVAKSLPLGEWEYVSKIPGITAVRALFQIVENVKEIEDRCIYRKYILTISKTHTQEVLPFFHRYPEEKETLRIYLERRKDKDVYEMAKKLGVTSDTLECVNENKSIMQWIKGTRSVMKSEARLAEEAAQKKEKEWARREEMEEEMERIEKELERRERKKRKKEGK